MIRELGITFLLIFFMLSTINTLLIMDNKFIGKCNQYYFSPKWIYKNTNMNILGTFLSFIFLFLIIPLYYIIIFIHWICHLRKKEKNYTNDSELIPEHYEKEIRKKVIEEFITFSNNLEYHHNLNDDWHKGFRACISKYREKAEQMKKGE